MKSRLRPQRFHIEYNGEIYTVIYEAGFAPMWAIYKGTRRVESKYVTGYKAWGDTMMPSQVKEKFINYIKEAVK